MYINNIRLNFRKLIYKIMNQPKEPINNENFPSKAKDDYDTMTKNNALNIGIPDNNTKQDRLQEEVLTSKKRKFDDINLTEDEKCCNSENNVKYDNKITKECETVISKKRKLNDCTLSNAIQTDDLSNFIKNKTTEKVSNKLQTNANKKNECEIIQLLLFLKE